MKKAIYTLFAIEDGAQIAYPYIADDYNESTHTFSLTYPTEYISTKAGDFRHRWAGTLIKDGSNNFQANLAHQTAILRITYANVPADAIDGTQRTLVAYFSFTNTPKGIADSIADILGADTYQITPTEAYARDNSNYYDSSTRAYQEQYGPASARPAINTTAQAFNALIPMTLNMTELNGNEKYKYIDSTLPTNAACPGTIHAGDILLYGNNCVVVFYKTFSTSYSYSKIGKITDSIGLEEAIGAVSIPIQFSH